MKRDTREIERGNRRKSATAGCGRRCRRRHQPKGLPEATVSGTLTGATDLLACPGSAEIFKGASCKVRKHTARVRELYRVRDFRTCLPRSRDSSENRDILTPTTLSDTWACLIGKAKRCHIADGGGRTVETLEMVKHLVANALGCSDLRLGGLECDKLRECPLLA